MHHECNSRGRSYVEYTLLHENVGNYRLELSYRTIVRVE